MKKLITGVAIAASLATGAFADNDSALIETNFLAELAEQETLAKKINDFEHVYIQTLAGRKNGLNDVEVKIGHREADLSLEAVTDYSLSYTKEGQFDINAKIIKSIDLGSAFYLSAGIERFNSKNETLNTNEEKDNFYIGAGFLTNITTDSVLVFGGKFGAERGTAGAEIHYSLHKDLRAIVKYEHSFDTENDSQNNLLAGLEFSF